MSSMSDLVFLLLIFFMITSTMVAPNALKLLLPRSNSQTSAKTVTTISITANQQQKLANESEPTISLHADRTVPIEAVVKVMNIAKDNHYKLILATAPLDK